MSRDVFDDGGLKQILDESKRERSAVAACFERLEKIQKAANCGNIPAIEAHLFSEQQCDFQYAKYAMFASIDGIVQAARNNRCADILFLCYLWKIFVFHERQKAIELLTGVPDPEKNIKILDMRERNMSDLVRISERHLKLTPYQVYISTDPKNRGALILLALLVNNPDKIFSQSKINYDCWLIILSTSLGFRDTSHNRLIWFGQLMRDIIKYKPPCRVEKKRSEPGCVVM